MRKGEQEEESAEGEDGSETRVHGWIEEELKSHAKEAQN